MAKEVDKLSDAALRRKLKEAKPCAVADGGGLTFTLSKSGTAAWVLRYRHGGRPRELTLGRYPDLSLKAARERARDERANIQRGIDVAAERQQQKRAAATAYTFAMLAADYMEKVMPDLAPSTAKQRRQHFKAHIIPALGDLPVRSVTAEDISWMLKQVGKKTTPNVAELVLTATSETFKHGQQVSAVTVNPCFGLSAPAIVGKPAATRLRLMLNEDELRILLPQLHTIGRPNELAVLILLSTCVRIGELTRAEWEHINLERGEWFIPDANSKTGRGFTVPLVPKVVEWFTELHTLACGSRFVLPARQTRRLRTYGKEMPFEQRALNAMLRKLAERLEGVRRFTPHDLRSTARSTLAALGISVIVAERCLNHALGGLVGIYDQHDYLPERRAALVKLNAFLLCCLEGRPYARDNVVALRAAA
jgi:integrase